MKRAFLKDHGKPALELIEESFVLLRTCPPSIHAAYFLGSIPFVAGLLIFCSDLSRNPDATDHLGAATLAMTVLFIWMKFFHARFCTHLLARLRGETPPVWFSMETARTLSLQTILQSTALFILPLAAIIALPFGWVYAFYQNVSTLDDGKTRLRNLFRSSARQSLLWPGQNHFLLLVLSGFGLFVFLNWITVGFSVPYLLKTFLGIETVFTSSPLSLLNTTFLAACAALAYLSIDPLTKACYVLRCFYGESLRSGDDLKSEVRRFSRRIPLVTACILLCLHLQPAHSAENPAPPKQAVVSEELDRSISDVISQQKYTWRNPKEKSAKKSNGLFSDFFRGIAEMKAQVAEYFSDLWEKIRKWIFGEEKNHGSESDFSWATPQLGLLFAVIAAVACGLALAFMRLSHRRRSSSVEATAILATPDIGSDDISASDLPEDDWSRMGRRFLEQGELRFALRAFYLASLAHLASRNFITIVRSKSNRDYERELRRRSHAHPGVSDAFSENVGIFDRSWYGSHHVDSDVVRHFMGNLEKIKAAT